MESFSQRYQWWPIRALIIAAWVWVTWFLYMTFPVRRHSFSHKGFDGLDEIGFALACGIFLCLWMLPGIGLAATFEPQPQPLPKSDAEWLREFRAKWEAKVKE